nr:MAG TPA: PHD domain of transcriptional enhancer, Asx [Crassvirales sp.]
MVVVLKLKWGCGEIKQVLSSCSCSMEALVICESYFKVYTII